MFDNAKNKIDANIVPGKKEGTSAAALKEVFNAVIDDTKDAINVASDSISPISIKPTTPLNELNTLPNAVYRAFGEGTYKFNPALQIVQGSAVNVIPDGYDVKFVKTDEGWKVASSVKMPEVDTSKLLSKQQDGVKLLASGIINPNIIDGKYFNSDGEILSNLSFKLKVFEITPASISAIKLEGNTHFAAPLYIAQFKGDYNNKENYIRGHKVLNSGLVNINEWFSIDPETKFIIILKSVDLSNSTDLNITDVKIKSKPINSGVDFPLINFPTTFGATDVTEIQLQQIRNSVLDAKFKATDSNINYYQIARIAKNSLSISSTVRHNTICIVKRSIEDDSVIKVYNYQANIIGGDNLTNINKLGNNGVQSILLTDDTFTCVLTIDTDAINEGQLINLAYPTTDTERVNLFAKFKFEDICFDKINSQEEDSQLPEPIIIQDKYVAEDGTIGSNQLAFYKRFDIEPNKIKRVRVVGQNYYSLICYYADFKDTSLTILGQKRKKQQSQLNNIDEWIDVSSDAVVIIIGTTNTSPYNYDINITEIELVNGDIIEDIDLINNNLYGISDAGYLPIQKESDYINIIAYGQSLMENNDPAVAVTTTAIENNFMAGTRPVHNGQTLTNLNPLVSVSGYGEIPLITAVNQYSQMYRRFKNKDAKFISNSCAKSNRSIETLSKENTNTTQFENGVNVYTNRFYNYLTKTKAIVDGLSKTISCPAIIYMQGETNYQGNGQGMTDGTDQTRDKDTYKALLLQLKNNMQNDIMSVYEQSEKPLFFIYQTGRQWASQKNLQITLAQQEFARENSDVILMNPDYAMSGMGTVSDHLSSNGARWYGELIAKSLYFTFIKNQESPIAEIKEVEISTSKKKIILTCKVPVMPLVIDTWTTKTNASMGFEIWNNNSKKTIDSVKIINGNQIELSLASMLDTGNVEVCYANGNTKGRGNVRDSDSYNAMYNYTDYTSVETATEEYVSKDEQGQVIYGKKYPLHNWLSNFYKLIIIE